MSIAISAALVMELRGRTGAGAMACKEALIKSQGDLEGALDELRKAGQAKADKKADRVAAEGAIAIAREGSSAVILEANSETDFVARDKNFTDFANKVAELALKQHIFTDIDALSQARFLDSSQNVEEVRHELVTKLGENIQLRRIQGLTSEGVIGSYLHGSRIGVLVALKKGSEALAKDIAMHIAASRPLCISKAEVSPQAIAKEREIFTAQARESGKPQEIIDKMIEGRINKFVDEVSLLGQPFVKDPSKKVGQLLKEQQAEITDFICFEVGEGIEKKETNFAAEVMAQVRDQ